jgi:nanoRNase/pAp phosphatase (c-di-AMP/oligoRNAs hydrolase)
MVEPTPPRRLPPSGAPDPRQVTIIGHGHRLLDTVGLLVGSRLDVQVVTSDGDLERLLAPYPGVTVTRVPADYPQPQKLPPPPYVVALDQADLVVRVRTWLPEVRSTFLLAGATRRKLLPAGWLNLLPPTEAARHRLRDRFAAMARVDALMAVARGKGRCVILVYNDPDPDAVGAALAVAALWRAAGADPVIRYTGEVQRYQNKLLLSWLDAGIERLGPDELASAGAVAVVDAQPGFWAEDPPRVDAVIDHHPPRPDTVAAYCDLRHGFGSSSTMLAEYLEAAEFPIDRRLGTALLYGIITDTDDLQRNAGSSDIRMYELLQHRADRHFIQRLKKSQVPMAMLDYIAWGIGHRVTYRDMVLVHFGTVPSSDILVQVADLLLLTCGISWVVVAGVRRHRDKGDKLVVIFRGDGHEVDVGRRATKAFAALGSAGGHRTMARAEIDVDGAQIEGTVDLLIGNLFRRMRPRRRSRFATIIRGHLAAPRPSDPDDFELTA